MGYRSILGPRHKGSFIARPEESILGKPTPISLQRVGGRMGGEGHTVPGMVSIARRPIGIELGPNEASTCEIISEFLLCTASIRQSPELQAARVASSW